MAIPGDDWTEITDPNDLNGSTLRILSMNTVDNSERLVRESVLRDWFLAQFDSQPYRQLFEPTHASNILTWSENGGVFPTNTLTSVYVYLNGKKLVEGVGQEYTISGSDITIDPTVHRANAYYEVIAWCPKINP